jgi:hypothetical protein
MNIISFNLFHGPHPLTRLRLLDPDTDRRLIPEPLTLGFFELRKPAPANQFNLECWRHYWLTGQALEDAPGYVLEAARIIRRVNLTRQERDMITAMERHRADIDAMIIYGENQGLERGLAQGRAQGRAEGLAAAKARLAEILRLHPGADPDTILKLMAEADG